MFPRWIALLAGVLCNVLIPLESMAQEQPLTFTEEQALRGQALYFQHCQACHGEEMGGLDKAPPLAGPQFSGVWNGESLMALVARIGTMPPDKPGSVPFNDTVDILTYMLWYNGLPIGTQPLSTEPGVLGQMTFQTLPPGK